MNALILNTLSASSLSLLLFITFSKSQSIQHQHYKVYIIFSIIVNAFDSFIIFSTNMMVMPEIETDMEMSMISP